MNGYYIRNQKKQKYKQRFCIDLEKGDYWRKGNSKLETKQLERGSSNIKN